MIESYAQETTWTFIVASQNDPKCLTSRCHHKSFISRTNAPAPVQLLVDIRFPNFQDALAFLFSAVLSNFQDMQLHHFFVKTWEDLPQSTGSSCLPKHSLDPNLVEQVAEPIILSSKPGWAASQQLLYIEYLLADSLLPKSHLQKIRLSNSNRSICLCF